MAPLPRLLDSHVARAMMASLPREPCAPPARYDDVYAFAAVCAFITRLRMLHAADDAARSFLL